MGPGMWDIKLLLHDANHCFRALAGLKQQPLGSDGLKNQDVNQKGEIL